MKRFASILMCCTSLLGPVAHAQTIQDGFARPPDVPAYENAFNSYRAGTTLNVLGDNSNPRGGTMPVIAEQLDDIPSVASGWKGSATEFLNIPPGTEMKMRTLGNLSHISHNDPIRNYGQPGTSHLHQFFGNTTINAFSTYASIRTRANELAANSKAASTVAGGPYNATGYWIPCPVKTNPFGNGKNYCVKINDIIIYYLQGPTDALSRLPRGLRYVLGTNMDDPDQASVIAEVAAANAQPGTSGRYSIPTTSGPKNDGFVGWECRTADNTTTIPPTAGGTYSPYLKSTTGVDPWGGNCLSGYSVSAHLVAPPCYDGNNLWSPGGYKHFRFPINDSVAGTTVCPNGWYLVPFLNLTVRFFHKGFSDYGNWRLSSDDMMQDKLTALGTPRSVANGESMHSDWMGGWDDTTFYGAGATLGWQKFCLGVDGNTPHECNSSQINATQYLVGGYAGEDAPDDSRVPQVNTSANQYDTSVASGMFEVPPTSPVDIHAGGH